MGIKRAEGIMIPLDAYPHIPFWFTLRQAVAEFEKSELEINGRKSLPRALLVFDQQDTLVGMVRRRDILRGLEPEFLGKRTPRSARDVFDVKVDSNLAELAYDRLIKRFRKRAERPVSEIMIPVVFTIQHDDSIMKIVNEMVDKDISLLPVMKGDKVIGVVRSVDAFTEVARLMLSGGADQ